MKINSFLPGIILGIVSPVLGILIFYFWKAANNPFSYFLQALIENKTLLTAAISFSLFVNAAVFTWAVNTGKDKMARARSIQARLRAHTVKFDKSGEWYPAFEEEEMKLILVGAALGGLAGLAQLVFVFGGA